MSTGKAFVDEKLNSKTVVIFSKSYCPYCVKAKALFAKLGLSPDVYEVIEIEDRADCARIQEYLKQLTGASTVPRIFIKKQSIGGCTEAQGLHKNGKLQQMLKEAGAK